MTEFRITESGDFRITEGSDSRILEKFGPTLTGVGSFSNYTSFALDFLSDYYLVTDPSGNINSRATLRAKFEAVAIPADRVTEAGDTRVTEDVLIRATGDFSSNSGSSSMTVFSNKIQFDSELYVKYLSNWKIGTPYVNHQNNWVMPVAIYKYVDNNWKRVN
jgi:hypothetical protein